MTRRGSIAYYSAVVVCGSFFLAATYYPYFLTQGAPTAHWARDFIVTYFFTVLVTFSPLVLVAFLLRRLARRFRWNSRWLWILTGTALFAAIVWLLGQVGEALQSTRGAVSWWRMALMFFLVGPMLALKNPFWLVIPPGALTSLVLYLIDRAFETPAPSQSP